MASRRIRSCWSSEILVVLFFVFFFFFPSFSTFMISINHLSIFSYRNDFYYCFIIIFYCLYIGIAVSYSCDYYCSFLLFFVISITFTIFSLLLLILFLFLLLPLLPPFSRQLYGLPASATSADILPRGVNVTCRDKRGNAATAPWNWKLASRVLRGPFIESTKRNIFSVDSICGETGNSCVCMHRSLLVMS